jgi:hypothetical protein
MTSSDLLETFGWMDRLLVLPRNLVATLATAETVQEGILAHAAGIATPNKGDIRMSDHKPTQVRRQP